MTIYEITEKCADIAAPLFSLMRWTYGDKGIPTHDVLEDAVTELIEYDKKRVATGRFMVDTYKNESGKKEVHVYLELCAAELDE